MRFAGGPRQTEAAVRISRRRVVKRPKKDKMIRIKTMGDAAVFVLVALAVVSGATAWRTPLMSRRIPIA
jgi:hypothetical protein